MKRLMVMGLTALGLVLALQQQASAWSRFKFGIGFNISWEGANNSFLFGLFKGGPAPGGGVDGSASAYPGGYADPNMPQGSPPPYSMGLNGEGMNGGPQGPLAPVPAQAPPPPAPAGPSSAQPVGYFANYQTAMNPYLPVSYNPYGNPYYGQGGNQGYAQPDTQAPGYWHPGSMQAPSYWYDR